MALYEGVPRWIIEIPDHLKTQEMCTETVRIEPRFLECVPDRSKTQICNETVPIYPYLLEHVPGHLKT